METRSPWFSVSHRELSSDETELVEALVKLLDELKPQRIDPGDTLVTDKGENILILVMPHLDLAGLSLVLEYYRELDKRAKVIKSSVGLIWAQIHTLISHDDIDKGHLVGLWDVVSPPAGHWVGPLRGMRKELSRRVEIRAIIEQKTSKLRRIKYYLEGIGKPVGTHDLIRTRSWSPLVRTRIDVSSCSFMDPEPPTYSFPPDVTRWQRA